MVGDGGWAAAMTDSSEQGAVPIEDAAVADPPTVNEVLEQSPFERTWAS